MKKIASMGAVLLAVGGLYVFYPASNPSKMDQKEALDVTQPALKQSAMDQSAVNPVWPELVSPLGYDQAIESRISQLLAHMTVAEKVGQMFQVEIQYISPQEVKDFHIGSVLNGGGSLPGRNKHATPQDWLGMADAFYDASMDTSDGGVAIPIIWGSDAVHGHNNVIGATLFPHNIALGAANNAELIRQIGRVTAREMRVTGIDWTFAPTLAVAQNDRWGRTYESYSEDPAIVKSFAGKMVEGLQGVIGDDDFLDEDHVVATAKHFVGDGGTVDGDDQGDTVIGEDELAQIHAAGYETALDAGVQTVMASFSSWNGVKMHGNEYLLTDVLKGRMGFDGLIVGDWNGHGQIPGCTNANCPDAINAGLDLFMVVEDWRELYANTLGQVKDGTIPMARVDDAVARILRVKLRAGLFDKGRPSDRGIAGQGDIIGSDDHQAIARQAVREGLVLLKNKGGHLPINPNKRILVAGDAADNIGKQSGGWTISWQGTGNVNADFPNAESIFAGISEAVAGAGGTAVLSEDGSYDEKPDVAVVVFGEEPYAEGQGDLESLEFEAGHKRSLALLKTFQDAGIPVVSVFLSGRPLWVNPELNASDAFVAAWLPGSEGAGVADVLIAKPDGQPRHDFRGKLSFSWPKTPLQDILNPNHDGYDPLFTLGYGLSYGTADQGPDALPVDVEGVMDANASRVDLFKGRPIAPWQTLLVDGRSMIQLSGAYAALPSGKGTLTSVDKDIQGDALRVEVAEGARAGIMLGAGPALDWGWTATLAVEGQDALISFDIKVDQIGDTAQLELECGDGCILVVDVTERLRAQPKDAWVRFAVPLSRFFSDADRPRENITIPFRLMLAGPSDVSIANILLDTEAEGAERLN